MMNAYDKDYLEDASGHLGTMLDYAVYMLNLPLRAFYDRFLASRVAVNFSLGHPKYVAGMSGIELARAVLEETGICPDEPSGAASGVYKNTRTDLYWTGWGLAQLQWASGWDFDQIDRRFPIEDILRLFYPLHEADISRFLDEAFRRLEAPVAGESPLKAHRKALGLTQSELSQRSGISLRMIRAYEQGAQPISRAEASTLLHLSHVLRCPPQQLL